MQATRYLIGVVVEFSPRVQHSHDDLGRGDSLLVLFGRNPSPVVRNRHRFIGVNDDVDLTAVASQGLVNTIIDQLEHHMM